jgi:uncharacterized protein YndB with AHSA1/START domain
MNQDVTASMLIRRGPSEIFEAFVDPDILCKFWLDAASGPLAPGAEVEWRFKVPGVSDVVKVTAFERPRRLAFRFSDGIHVDVGFEFHDGDATRVSVSCTGFPETELLDQATNTVEGFSIVLCDLKTLLETGRSANLVRDKAELITRSMAKTGGG